MNKLILNLGIIAVMLLICIVILINSINSGSTVRIVLAAIGCAGFLALKIALLLQIKKESKSNSINSETY